MMTLTSVTIEEANLLSIFGSKLDRCWSILGGVGADFSHFSDNFSIIFVGLLGFVSYSSSVYICTDSCTLFV